MKHDPDVNETDPEGWNNKPTKIVHKKTVLGYLLKVELCDISPAIWRSFTVPADITLGDLHTVLQIVMGWTNSHLHGFRDEENCYGPFDETLEDQIDETGVLLSDLFKRKGPALLYEYDFGDGWEHLITCEEFLSKETEIAVIDGKRACPPDDCGGVPGYYQILEALEDDSDDDEHDDLMDWLGDDYDPQFYDAEAVNRALQKISLSNL